jgi:hypothetical protein
MRSNELKTNEDIFLLLSEVFSDVIDDLRSEHSDRIHLDEYRSELGDYIYMHMGKRFLNSNDRRIIRWRFTFLCAQIWEKISDF